MTRKVLDQPSPIDLCTRPVTTHDPLEGKTPGGMIITGASRLRVPPAFEPVLASAVAMLAEQAGSPSLYLYGSVATGTARLGQSDVDLATLGLPPAVATQLGQALSADHAHLCRSVDIGAAQIADHEGASDQAYGNRAFLRHYCVHLAGPNPADQLPDFAADQAAARGFNGDINLCAKRWRDSLNSDRCPTDLGRRVARKTLLAAASLVSVRDGTWTTDRIAGAWRWGQMRPDLAGELGELLAWSSHGAKSPQHLQVQAVLDGVVAELVNEFRRDVGLWA